MQIPSNIATAGFVVKLYNINDVDKYDEVRMTLFSKCRNLNFSSQQAILSPSHPMYCMEGGPHI